MMDNEVRIRLMIGFFVGIFHKNEARESDRKPMIGNR